MFKKRLDESLVDCSMGERERAAPPRWPSSVWDTAARHECFCAPVIDPWSVLLPSTIKPKRIDPLAFYVNLPRGNFLFQLFQPAKQVIRALQNLVKRLPKICNLMLNDDSITVDART